MGVKVYQSRRDNRSGYVADLGACIGLQSASDLHHLAPRECDVGDGIDLLRRIDDPAAAQDEVIRHAGISAFFAGASSRSREYRLLAIRWIAAPKNRA